MARTNLTINKEILKDRRVVTALAVVGLLGLGAVVFLLVSNNNGSDSAVATTSTSAPSEGPGGPGDMPGIPGAAGGYPGSGYPGAGSSGAAYPTVASSSGPSSVAPSVRGTRAGSGAAAPANVRTSFDGAPTTLGTTGGASTASPLPGGVPGDVSPISVSPMAPAAGGSSSTSALAPAPPGVTKGRRAVAARPDPFLSFVKPARFQPPPAYQFVVPMRLASTARPVVVSASAGEPVTLGPLPYVPRRVAGILTDGAVSAILETGNPGADADVRVVQPGASVPSGDPRFNLTVEAITSTGLTLRAPDRRSVDVKLSKLPPEVAEQMRSQAVGGAGGGYPGGVGGGGGYPGAGGGGGYPGGGYPGGLR
jgi:hypothetical protein